MLEPAAKRVLVVDDDPSIRELLTGFLEGKGYEISACGDGKEVPSLLADFRPDLVLLDLELPGMSGLDLLRDMTSEGIDTPVIAISGHEAAAEHLGPDGIRLGANLFMTKPIDLEELELAISGELSPSRRSTTSVLVVDDDPVIRDLLVGFLSDKGYRVLTADDGEAALQAVRDESPDLMLLDLYLPKLSGVEVLERLAADGVKLPVITISGTGDDEVARSTFRLGAADFIVKPLDLDYLELSLMAKLLSLGP